MASKIDCKIADGKIELYLCYEGEKSNEFEMLFLPIMLLFLDEAKKLRVKEVDEVQDD